METQVFDTLILEIQKEGKALASIAIKEEDLKRIVETTEYSEGDILGDMFNQMVEGLSEKNSEEIEEEVNTDTDNS
jgi:nitrate/nitrite-specific signal transduction histidine kinase